MIHPRDFTQVAYRKMLSTISSEGFKFYPVIRWISEPDPSGIVLRHDVDRKPGNSLQVARMEAELGIKSTYYFRITSNSFDVDVIKAISKMGHEIGYHFEALSYVGGDLAAAREHFSESLARLREVAEIKTVAMHGSPLSRHDNRDYFRLTGDTLESNGLIADAFETIDYTGVHYFTDTGRSWADNRFNLRDRPPNIIRSSVSSTEELTDFFLKMRPQKAAIVMHPERWTDSRIGWIGQLAKDQAVNFAKLARSKVL